MKIRNKIAVLAFAIAGVTGLGLAAAGPALAETTTTNALSYEFDNGNFTGSTFWTLQKNAAALHASVHDYGYADAGIVVDLGPASSFSGITVTGSGSYQVNVWIGDGTDAYTPGSYSTANFSYGFQQPNGTFWMTSGPDAGSYLSASDIASGFSQYEVYAWVGVVYTGSTVSASVTSVNGHSVGNRTMSLTPDGSGSVVAVIK